MLRWLAHAFETLPYLRDDELAQAGARLVYYMSCPATRAGLIAAAREMALEPAYGERGVLDAASARSRCRRRSCGASAISSCRCASRAPSRARCPTCRRLLLPCVGHWINGPHHRCLAEAVAGLVIGGLDAAAHETPRARERRAVRVCVPASPRRSVAPRAGVLDPSHGA